MPFEVILNYLRIGRYCINLEKFIDHLTNASNYKPAFDLRHFRCITPFMDLIIGDPNYKNIQYIAGLLHKEYIVTTVFYSLCVVALRLFYEQS